MARGAATTHRLASTISSALARLSHPNRRGRSFRSAYLAIVKTSDAGAEAPVALLAMTMSV